MTMRRALLITALLVLLLPAQARAGTLIDRAVAGLQTDNVYVDPDADPTLTDAEADELRDRIISARADPMFVVIAPREIAREAGGSPATADVLPTGEAGELAKDAVAAGKPDLDAILLDLTDRVGEARTGGAENGGGVPGGAIILVGAGALGG